MSDLSQAIMNLPADTILEGDCRRAYLFGHRDARHSAAELVLAHLEQVPEGVLGELAELLRLPHLTVTPITVRGNDEYAWLQGADGVFAHSPAGMNPNDAKVFAALRNHARCLISQAARAERLEIACRAAIGFVGHSADAMDWCGCEDCREEWGEILVNLKAALADQSAARAAGGKPANA